MEAKLKSASCAFLFFALLSLVLTFPLALHLSGAVEDRQDALLNVWIMAWDGHQLLSDPLHLFDANIFWPQRTTLAYSELLLGNGLLALPITAASGNPVLGYNAALLLSFALTGLGTYLLVSSLTRSPGAGLVAGAVLAFCSYRMTNLAQAQLLATQWMPFALLSLRLLVRRPGPARLAVLVLFVCLQTLSSLYYGVILLLALLVLGGGFWLGRRSPAPPEGRAARSRARPAVYLVLACALAALLILPFALPYLRVQREQGFERSLADSEPFSASLRQYLTVPAGSMLYAGWLPVEEVPRDGGYPVDALFPGVTTLALALVGIGLGRGRLRWFALLALAAAFVLSLGPRLYLAPEEPAAWAARLPYAWLYSVVPGFKALRAPVRFDALVMLALSILAGYGAAALGRLLSGSTRRPVRSGRRRMGILALLGLVVLESLTWPAAHAEAVPVGREVPPVYRWLAVQPVRPVLELPMAFTPGGPQLDYQYLSTYHWQPTPDGYSGFIPPAHGQVVYEMERFPSERSVSLLQALGVQQAVIHTGRYPADRWLAMQDGLAQAEDLAAAGAFGPDRVYSVLPRPAAAGLSAVGYLPPRAAAGLPYTAYAVLVNRGERSYAVPPPAAYRAECAWEGAGLSLSGLASYTAPLVTSPGGGAAVLALPLTAPDRDGTYHLVLGQQEGFAGPWRLEGDVVVGGAGGTGPEQFPVPARLAGWNLPSTLRAGEAFPVSLTWRALGKIDAYYSVYVKLLDGAGNALAAWDGQPRNGAAPTLLWVPGETIDDTIVLTPPSDLPAGEYVVEVGMYRAGDLARALTLSADGGLLDRVTLGAVRAEP